MMKNIITIDGPVASGKSSLARALANKLGYYHINSGYFYRSLAYILIKFCKKTLDDLRALDQEDIECIDLNKLEYVYDEGRPQVFYQGTDLTPHLKTRDIDDGASTISTYPFIREAVNKFQHQLAGDHDIVIDGRDIGTIVFPEAKIKIFLTASEEERTSRWQNDQRKKGNIFSFDQSLAEVQERDRRDTTRSIAPLTIPENGLVIDNSNRSNEDVVREVLELI
ncbi:(d)CMP kinase [bacterium]|jgi:CMP/dCMP kinase|nr:(d)CMP kinase [bacterium]